MATFGEHRCPRSASVEQLVWQNSRTSADLLLGLWLNGACHCLSYRRLSRFHPISVRGASEKSIKVSWSVAAPVVHRSARRSAKAPFAILIIFELAVRPHFPHQLPSQVHRCHNQSYIRTSVNLPFLNPVSQNSCGLFESSCKKQIDYILILGWTDLFWFFHLYKYGTHLVYTLLILGQFYFLRFSGVPLRMVCLFYQQ